MMHAVLMLLSLASAFGIGCNKKSSVKHANIAIGAALYTHRHWSACASLQTQMLNVVLTRDETPIECVSVPPHQNLSLLFREKEVLKNAYAEHVSRLLKELGSKEAL